MFCNRISKAFDTALHLPLMNNSKYVIFSDCHRGTGSVNDNFLKNEFIFQAALKYYYNLDFTYIELGDGDELWENRLFEPIKEMHAETFELMSKYYNSDRFYSVYGNHDIVKRNKVNSDKFCTLYYCEKSFCRKNLFSGITFYPGIILDDCDGKKNIYLTHGHQADFMNSTMWPLSRFLVRYVWRPFELLGIPDPTSAAKNNTRKSKTEQCLSNWAKKNNRLLITGHTHRPVMGDKDSPYFNTGSCVSPCGITCIEIEQRCIRLIKWFLNTDSNLTVSVKKSRLGSEISIDKL